MQLGMSRDKRACRLFAMAAFFVLSAAAIPASGFQPPSPDELDFLVRAGNARLAAATAGRGLSGIVAPPSWHLHDNQPGKLPSLAPVWNVTQHWKVALDSRIFVDPERAARAAVGFVEIGAIYSPLKDLDFGVGLVRNAKDGALSAMVFTMGVSARY